MNIPWGRGRGKQHYYSNKYTESNYFEGLTGSVSLPGFMTRVITASCGTAWPQEQRLDIRKPRTEIEQVTLNSEKESVMAHSNMMTSFYPPAANEYREMRLICNI